MRSLFCLILAAAAVHAGEGKWTPMQVLELDPAALQKQGLELSVSRLWDAKRGTGLLSAAVSLGGCSAAFVSPTGLIATNHHCLFSVLQEHSRPGRDLTTGGFLARDRREELPSKTTRVTVPRRFTDVTGQIESAAPRGADDAQRFRAIEDKKNQLVAECEKRPHSRCRVAVMDGGVQYVLVETTELQDIRLVYAPPRAVGEFGGEVDNWMWPRHTGDFSMARAYVAPDGNPAPYAESNVPYKPEFYLPISTKGVKPGDFVMVLGYPGATVRSLTAAEMEDRRDEHFARRVQLYGEWIERIEQTTKNDPAGTIALASSLKTLLNRYKNSQGQLAGLKRGNIIENQRAQEAVVAAWARERAEWKQAADALAELNRLAAEKRKTAARDFIFAEIPNGALALKHAAQLVRLAQERQKPDAQRETDYMQREIPRLRDRMEREQKSYFEYSDMAQFASLMKLTRTLDSGQRIKAFDRYFGGEDPGDGVIALYKHTKVTNLAERLRMFDETPDQLRARKDPMLDFAFELNSELRAWNEAARNRDGAIARLRPLWRRAVIAHAGKPIAPDANSTLRVSFAHVKGYIPREGVLYTPQTTLAGMIEKHTGEEPFNVPEPVRAAAEKTDPASVPLCFLADADTTGGNSGSPTVNGRGELVGLNFDRVWENVANDFGYNPGIARNVNVDIRFMLWMLENVHGAGALLEELGARK